MTLRMPLVLTERVVLPYSEATVTVLSATTPAPGSAVVVLRSGRKGDSGVGAVARVTASRRLDDDVVQIRVATGSRAVVDGPGEQQLMPVEAEARDTAGPGAQAALEEAGDALTSYLAALAESGESASVMVDLPAEPVVASYRVASLVRVSDPELQALLDVESAADRLAALSVLLRRERRLLEEMMARKEW